MSILNQISYFRVSGRAILVIEDHKTDLEELLLKEPSFDVLQEATFEKNLKAASQRCNCKKFACCLAGSAATAKVFPRGKSNSRQFYFFEPENGLGVN